VLPIDVTTSRWACTREGPAVRLGLRYVRGLRESAAAALETSRGASPFTSPDDLRRRAGLTARELETLAELGALARVDPGRPYQRREALWQVRAMTATPEGLFSHGDTAREDAPVPAMTLAERLAADYRTSGMTVGPHPLALYRAALSARGVVPAAGLSRLNDGASVQVAGAVITRQRPETAKGFFFLTLEDETGIANGIVAPRVFEAQRALFVDSAVLLVHGALQHQDGVVSVKVHAAEPLDDHTEPVALPDSHDFR
jgi:error-prone DNA polymerase